MNIASWLSRAGLSHPGLPAVGHGPRVAQSYGTLAGRAARLAGALHRLGLKPGDHVAVVAKNCVEYVETIFGIWHGGFAAVPARSEEHTSELQSHSDLVCRLLLEKKNPRILNSFQHVRP